MSSQTPVQQESNLPDITQKDLVVNEAACLIQRSVPGMTNAQTGELSDLIAEFMKARKLVVPVPEQCFYTVGVEYVLGSVKEYMVSVPTMIPENQREDVACNLALLKHEDTLEHGEEYSVLLPSGERVPNASGQILPESGLQVAAYPVEITKTEFDFGFRSLTVIEFQSNGIVGIS